MLKRPVYPWASLLFMEEFEEIENRVISGRGVLRVPSEEEGIRCFSLVVDVIRRPSQEYINTNWYPPRSRYANLTFFRDGYLVETRAIEYPNSLLDWTFDVSGQTLLAVKCSYEGVLQTFFNLGNALALPSISVTNLIADFAYLDLYWDTCVAECYADTAIQLSLRRLKYDTCNASADKKKRPPPPSPPPSFPPGTPFDGRDGNPLVSPPYEGDDITSPYEGDLDEPDNSQGQRCVAYRVTIRIASPGLFPPGYSESTLECFGEFEAFVDPDNNTRVLFSSYGGYEGGNGVCRDTPEIVELVEGYAPPITITYPSVIEL